jgi:HSP20 family molecular chaperone IbpA
VAAPAGKKTVTYEQGVSVHRRERLAGTFNRTFSLPIQIDADELSLS